MRLSCVLLAAEAGLPCLWKAWDRPLTALKQNTMFLVVMRVIIFNSEGPWLQVKRAKKVRSCLAEQLSRPHGQLSWKGTDLPFCSCMLLASPFAQVLKLI